MKQGLVNRLLEVIDLDPRTDREVSEAAGCGQNYVQQMRTNRKQPGTARLLRLLDVLGSENALYIIAGERITAEDAQFLEIIHRLSPDARKAAATLLAQLASAKDD